MDFATKLDHLTRGQNKSALARAAGLGETTISSYIAKGSTPRADIALAIANALQVPLAWLVDPETELPAPESAEKPLRLYEERDLLKELATRYRHKALEVFRRIDMVVAGDPDDWVEVAAELVAIPLGEPVPDHLERYVDAASNTSTPLTKLRAMMPDRFANLFHEQMPGGEMRRGALDFDYLQKLADEIPENMNAGIDAARFYWELREMYSAGAGDPELWEEQRELLAVSLRKGVDRIPAQWLVDNRMAFEANREVEESYPFKREAEKTKPNKGARAKKKVAKKAPKRGPQLGPENIPPES